MSSRISPRALVRRARNFTAELSEVIATAKASHESVNQARAAEYASYLHKTKINEHLVLYESFWGRGIVDNPYAIFLHLLDDPAFKDFTHVWCIADLEDGDPLVKRYADRPNVRFVQCHSSEYLKVLASAKYLVNNVTFPPYFAKRKGQVYVNTWHGTPLKAMGYEQTGGNVESANTVRNFLASDYLISANPIMTRMYLKSYKLEEIFSGAVIEEGYPRNDLLFTTPRSEIVEKLALYGIEVDPGKQVILYAPTWRQGTRSKAVVNGEELLAMKRGLEDALDPEKYQVLIKPHQFVYNALKDEEAYRGLLVPSTLDANEVMSIVDILISDYSSIFLDYLATGRPVLFFMNDAENYAEARGLAYTLDELPGPYTQSIGELVGFIGDIDAVTEKYRDRYQRIASEVTGHDDGHVTSRVVSEIFSDVASADPSVHTDGLIRGTHEKKRLLLSVGVMLENGIVHSFLSLLNAIDYDEWDVTAYVSMQGNDFEMRRKINEDINEHARVLMRVGPPDNTLTEQIRRVIAENHGLYRKLWKSVYPDELMSLEFRRAFGDTEFDYIVDFCGYSRFYAPMLLAGPAKKHSVWLHNDIKADMNRKVLGEKPNYISLKMVISLYQRYENLVSCGRSVMKVNRKKLATPETYEKFTYAKNTFDSVRFRKCMKGDDVFELDGKEYLLTTPLQNLSASCRISYLELPDQNLTNFVTMGRFSTEKNHLRLIKAFAQYLEEYPNSRLYIIGGGPLEEDTQKLVKRLGLEEKVLLPGRLRNPYALMSRCDCFILPSIHEGQPLVLLEARACGLPIIVSNFSSVVDSLIPDGQLVIEPTIDGIRDGLLSFARGDVPTTDFDIDVYNHEAYEEFVNAIS